MHETYSEENVDCKKLEYHFSAQQLRNVFCLTEQQNHIPAAVGKERVYWFVKEIFKEIYLHSTREHIKIIHSERFQRNAKITKYAVNKYMKYLKQDIYQIFAHTLITLSGNILPLLSMTHIRFSLLNSRTRKIIKQTNHKKPKTKTKNKQNKSNKPNQSKLQINLSIPYFWWGIDKHYFLLKIFIISGK